jgi:hypothetical protein
MGEGMSQLIEVKIPINSLSASLELYHQARLSGAVDYHSYSENPYRSHEQTLNVFFDPADAEKAMLFKLTYGGAA